MKCPYCFSTQVRVQHSEDTREAVEIRCERCGRVSMIDVENFNVESDELPQDRLAAEP